MFVSSMPVQVDKMVNFEDVLFTKEGEFAKGSNQ